MVNLKFLIDITRSNQNNIPAIYHYLDQLLTWLEEKLLDSCGGEKQYVAGYFSGEGLFGKQKVFTKKADFLKNFMQQKIQNGNPDGKENMIKAIEDMLNYEVAEENALFVFTDQSVDQEYMFRPLNGSTYHLAAVFLFADYSTNVKVKNLTRLDFVIDRDKSGVSDVPVDNDLDTIKRADALHGGAADIRMLVGKLFAQDSREVQRLL